MFNTMLTLIENLRLNTGDFATALISKIVDIMITV